MNKNPQLSTEEFHAFLDGELSAARARDVANIVAGDRALAAELAAFRSDKETLQELFHDVSRQPLPQEWLDRVAAHATRRNGPRAVRFVSVGSLLAGWKLSRSAVMALAACLLVAIGSWFVLNGPMSVSQDTIVAEALAARAGDVQPAQSFTVAALGTSTKGNEIVSEALGLALKVPDLAGLGFVLSEVRVYSDVPGGMAVRLDYRDETARVFTMYMRRPSGPPNVDMIQRDGVWTCIWQDDVLGTVMVGELSAGEMARMASLAYNGLYL